MGSGLRVIIAQLIALPLLAEMVMMLFGIHWMVIPPLVAAVMAAISLFWLGGNLFKTTVKGLRHGALSMDSLVVLGTVAAYGLSIYNIVTNAGAGYFEAVAVLVAFVLLGKWLEDRAKLRTGDAISALHKLAPQQVRLITKDHTSGKITEHWSEPDAVQLGDLVLVMAGERIPVDGEITAGEASLDLSMLTGESMPIAKQIGDRVVTGAMNLDGRLEVKVTAKGADTMLAAIIRSVETAQNSKSPIQRFVNQVSTIFVPTVLVIAIGTFAVWMMLGNGVSESIIAAVGVLVISCPCALGLATPTAMMVGTGLAAKRGILIRNAESLEAAGKVTLVAFDKTGTLTIGKPTVTDLVVTENSGINRDQCLALAQALQAGSSHPLAMAILECKFDQPQTMAQQKPKPKTATGTATSLKSIHGHGVQGQVNGRQLMLGNHAMVNANLPKLAPSLESLFAIDGLAASGKSISYLCELLPQPRILCLFAFSDQLRAGAELAIAQFHRAAIKTVLISGDSTAATGFMAKKLAIERYFGEVLPDDKRAIVESLKENGSERVAMIGDGVNDAPALAAADLAIALASGSDSAMASADIVLMRSEPQLIVEALTLARRIRSKIRQGLGWAFAYNIVAIPIAAMGLLNPAVAGAAMAASSIAVVLNALSLRLHWSRR